MADYLLQTKSLNKSFGAIKATSNLDLQIERGHIHAIIGPNGAGKTTLVNQLTGDIFSDSGKIIFQGKNITRKKDYIRSRLGIARSFQITHIFENLTVAENLAVSICASSGHNFHFFRKALNTRIVREKLPAALDRIGLTERSDLQARYLSHGEKRQLEVGMALTGDPDLLILDEPMAGMGPGGTVEMTKLIRRLNIDMTILLVEHDMEVVFSLADMVSVIVYGENILTAPPEAVKRDKQVKEAYLGDEQ